MVETPENPAPVESNALSSAPTGGASAASAAPAVSAADAGPAAHDDAREPAPPPRGESAGAAEPGPAGPDAGKQPRGKRAAGPEGPPPGAEGEGDGSGARRDRGPGAKNRSAPPSRERAAFQVGEEVFGKVTSVLDNAIMVDLAGKALAIFDRGELAADDLVPSVGDRFVAQVLGDGGRGGLVVLTRKPLREEEAKPRVELALKDRSLVPGLVTGVVRGGLEVYVDGLRAFAPASHVDLRVGADLVHLIGQRLPFHVEEYGKRGRDVVLSRRVMLEEEARKVRDVSLAKLAPGSVVKGVVRSIVGWGVFVAIVEADEVEGLVHNSELSHDPRAKTADIARVGDTIDVKILRIDEKGKLWLSKKATEPDPWEELRTKYAVGTLHQGKVIKLQPFGAFVELEPGMEGLIHCADLSFKRFDNPEEVISLGQELSVVVASNDPATHKIGLHPAPPGFEKEPRQKIVPHKSVKVAVVTQEPAGLVVRVLGATGRTSRGFIPAGQTGTPRGADLRKAFPAGTQLEVKVLDIDPRRGEAKLSIKGLHEDTEKSAYNEYRQSVAKEAKFGTFADLLKKS